MEHPFDVHQPGESTLVIWKFAPAIKMWFLYDLARGAKSSSLMWFAQCSFPQYQVCVPAFVSFGC